MTLATSPTDRTGGSAQPSAIPIYFGLLASPAAWLLQENVCFGLASHACFPRKEPLASFLAGYQGVWGVLVIINLLLLAVCLVGLVSSFYALGSLRRPLPAGPPDDRRRKASRLRAFAGSSALASLLFFVAIGANTISLMTLSSCSLA